MTHSPLYVSAFYDIGRHTWNDRFRCNPDCYTAYIDELISRIPNIVIYLDEDLYRKYHATHGDKIQNYNPSETFLSWTVEKEGLIIANDLYKQEILHRLDFPEHCRPLYTTVNHNKVHFLKRAQEAHPKYSHYVWIDIHYFRHRDYPYFSQNTSTEKITIGTSRWNLGDLTPKDIMKSEFDHLQGSVIIVPSSLVPTLYSQYVKQLQDNYANYIVDDDQGIHLGIYQRMPELYNPVYTGQFGVFFKIYSKFAICEYNLDTLNMSTIDLSRKTELCDIMTEERSDKGSGWHNYTIIYDHIFKQSKHKPINLFEMGLGSKDPNIPSNKDPNIPSNMGINGRPGASLYGWNRYFTNPNSICWGGDIDPTIQINTDKILTFYSDQLNNDILRNMWLNEKLADKYFDIIIDDGLHTFAANKSMFENSIYKLKAGGIYIVEDINRNELQLFTQYMNTIKTYLPFSTVKLLDIPNPQNHIDNICLFVQKRCTSRFTDTFNQYHYVFKQLSDIMTPTFEQWKGNGSYLINGQNTLYEPCMLPKQEALFEYAKGRKRLLEIGVHGGHSLFIILMANPNIVIDAIDLCLWSHTEKCVEYLNSVFNNRIKLIKGDSLASLHLVTSNKYDLLHLDGNHSLEYIKAEFNQLKNSMEDNAIVVFDDIFSPKVAPYVLKNNDLIVLEIPECPWTNCITVARNSSLKRPKIL